MKTNAFANRWSTGFSRIKPARWSVLGLVLTLPHCASRRLFNTLLVMLQLSTLIWLPACSDRAAREASDITTCKQYLVEMAVRMSDLKRDSLRPTDLTLAQLRLLTPRDRDWLDAQFLVLNDGWAYQQGPKKIVIICTQSRIDERGDRVYCAAYNTGEIAWLTVDALAQFHLKDFMVLPKVR